ncbi:2-polyprenyl-3-methyl-5-hydroxy-6-metoxy-1,4-benzoquinol methylase [Lipingzhangella halophila]|uniref:2-polyprenyl-3-methyl-5-hydroxy-6-metoxy-1, 4-benzoquinol methylase n=1 Tax=Lipingzhangella halophila TaxID=1783352 RepID=A0A7W7RCA8_9ACTN|nr:class I SAM-dependent methyltransferase [Lipingzhangella halophila]MBB4929210.1 2-polyprenyl-3-methyl-5-hydroxy-6-metoxy-1,4-benzoquinol methylase [Lipingzhangella halophila]
MTTELHRQQTSAPTKAASGTTVYAGAISSSTDLGGQQLGYLEELLDQPTTRFIGDVAAREGQRCLDLGAGRGSIARWLAGRTAPTGRVTAVDIEDTHIDVPPAVRVYRHDVNEGLPDKGPFDVIHTRLLLVHLKRRRELLAQLIDALAPGGWLVIGEFTHPRTDPVTG